METSDPPLAAELRALVGVLEADPDFMEESAALRLRENEDSDLPESIGSCRVVSILGSGGMGTVYLGVRDDDQSVQEVAIKVIKRGLDTNEIVRRFRQERQIMAKLQHEQIARLLDGGSTADGRAYFVLERIHEQRIDICCTEWNLCLEDRVRLFRRVCDAVTYAHQHEIIHRDLKPSNILVATDGVPKLLDFGVAKWLAVPESMSTQTLGL